MDEIPIRQEITVLPADDPKKLKIGWVIHEIPPDQTIDDYYKELLSEEDYKKWKYDNSHERGQETDVADGFLSHHGQSPSEPKSSSSTTVRILGEELDGQPWNNLALNFVLSMEPNFLRVTEGSITLDSHPGRITVYLEEDCRTIRYIEKEVSIPTNGAKNGQDLNLQLSYQKKYGNLIGYDYNDYDCRCFINDEAIKRVNFTKEDD